MILPLIIAFISGLFFSKYTDISCWAIILIVISVWFIAIFIGLIFGVIFMTRVRGKNFFCGPPLTPIENVVIDIQQILIILVMGYIFTKVGSVFPKTWLSMTAYGLLIVGLGQSMGAIISCIRNKIPISILGFYCFFIIAALFPIFRFFSNIAEIKKDVISITIGIAICIVSFIIFLIYLRLKENYVEEYEKVKKEIDDDDIDIEIKKITKKMEIDDTASYSHNKKMASFSCICKAFFSDGTDVECNVKLSSADGILRITDLRTGEYYLGIPFDGSSKIEFPSYNEVLIYSLRNRNNRVKLIMNPKNIEDLMYVITHG